MPESPPQFSLQSMPPRAAHFCLGLERFCREELDVALAGTRIVVAYSGGADSKALLFALRGLAPRLGITLHVAILDHGLRAEAPMEVTQASMLCAELGIAFHTDKTNVATLAHERGVGIEEAGREARLAFLERVRVSTQSDWISFGHQLNDLAEDTLMRLMRGSGWPALAGMVGVCHERHILRPLLLTPRADVERFLHHLGLTWGEDPMNYDDAYLRNRVRRDVLPLMLRENPKFLDTVAERWRMARADAVLFTKQTMAIPSVSLDGDVFFEKSALEDASPAIRQRRYRNVLASLGPGHVTALLLRTLEKTWRRGKGEKTVQFPGGKEAYIRHGDILFRRRRSRTL